MDSTERERLRTDLRGDDVGAADAAMLALLDALDPADLDPGDVTDALDAMDRLGGAAQASMFESFMLLAARFPGVTLPVLVRRLVSEPRAWSAGLAAGVIHELRDAGAAVPREQVVPALAAVVQAAAGDPWTAPAEAVDVLRDWTQSEPLPEAGPAIAHWLLRAADQTAPDEQVLRSGRETLEASGQESLLAKVRERAASLTADHPLRLALDGP